MNNWALFNLALAFITGIIAIIFLCRRKNSNLTPVQIKRVRMAKSISVEIGFVSCLVCLFSEHIEAMSQWADRWTIIMLILLSGEILSVYYVYKRCKGSDAISEKEDK